MTERPNAVDVADRLLITSVAELFARGSIAAIQTMARGFSHEPVDERDAGRDAGSRQVAMKPSGQEKVSGGTVGVDRASTEPPVDSDYRVTGEPSADPDGTKNVQRSSADDIHARPAPEPPAPLFLGNLAAWPLGEKSASWPASKPPATASWPASKPHTDELLCGEPRTQLRMTMLRARPDAQPAPTRLPQRRIDG